MKLGINVIIRLTNGGYPVHTLTSPLVVRSGKRIFMVIFYQILHKTSQNIKFGRDRITVRLGHC